MEGGRSFIGAGCERKPNELRRQQTKPNDGTLNIVPPSSLICYRQENAPTGSKVHCLGLSIKFTIYRQDQVWDGLSQGLEKAENSAC